MKLTPRALIRQTMNDAERVLDTANQGNTVVSKKDYERLPSSMKTIVDGFRASGQKTVKGQDILGALRTGLEGALSESLKSGTLVASEVIKAQGLVSGSPLTIKALTATPQTPQTAGDAKASVQFALQNADASLRSQLGTQKTLENALNVLKNDNPTSNETKALETLVKDRARLMRDVANNDVKGAESAQKRAGDAPGAKQATRVALVAAQEVQKSVNPKSSALKTLRQKEAKLTDSAAGRPFFARFLENQNRAGAAPQMEAAAAVQAVAKPGAGPEVDFAGVMVKDLKGNDAAYVMRGGVPYEIIADTPEVKAALTSLDGNDAAAVQIGGRLGRLDDPSGGPPRAVIFATTMEATPQKAVNLNGRVVQGEGAEAGKLMLETSGRRFEIELKGKDAQKALADLPEGGLQVTLNGVPSEVEADGTSKLVFAAESVDVKGPGTIMVTKKFPSDAEDSGDGEVGGGDPIMVTMKAPSDHEDSGDGSIGGPPLTTEKFPSDAEDNAGDDPGVYVTLKAPSDNEDGGDNSGNGPDIFVTMKAPSDHEDGGDGWIGVEPMPQQPGGDGDGAPAGGVPEDGGYATRKYPSDNEDGGDGVDSVGDGGMVTRKYPSDAEDGGDGVGEGGNVGVTERYPSDNEDVGDGDSIFTTLKYPSDNEDGGTQDPGGVMVTMKAPSDAEDAGDGSVGGDTGGMVVTLKFPSDNEDGGDGTGGLPDVTERFPSDNEDIGDGGDVDIGDMVTLKFPSDNEDGGGGDVGGIATEKYPSDNEDGGDAGDPGDIGDIVTAKFPSDNEDSGSDGIMTTMKYPSDNEDGGTTEPAGVGVEPIPEDSGEEV